MCIPALLRLALKTLTLAEFTIKPQQPLRPLTCLVAGLFSCACNASLVFYYQAYLLEGQIGVEEFLLREKDHKHPDGTVTITFDHSGEIRDATLNAHKFTCRAVPLASYGKQDPSVEFSLGQLSLTAAKTVSDTVATGFGIAGIATKLVVNTLARQLSGNHQRSPYPGHPYEIYEEFEELRHEQAELIPVSAQVQSINTLLHFFFEAPQGSQYIVTETEEVIGLKRQITSKSIRYKHPGHPSFKRTYVMPADERDEREGDEHRHRPVDFRNGYQPVAPLLPGTGGSLQPANDAAFQNLLYYMPSLNKRQEPETVMGLSSFLEMSRIPGSYQDIPKRCWLPELVATSSDRKVVCHFATQRTDARPTATDQDSGITDAREEDSDEEDDIVKCLTEACANSSYKSDRKAEMDPLNTMLDESTRVSQIHLPGGKGYVNTYSSETSEWQYILWYDAGVRLLLVKESSHNGTPFHTPPALPSTARAGR